MCSQFQVIVFVRERWLVKDVMRRLFRLLLMLCAIPVIEMFVELICVAGCTVLDVDPGKSTNRTVYTFVGDKKSVVEGALNACRVAWELIDMTKQHGEHPRMGACDVCPFIPISVDIWFHFNM